MKRILVTGSRHWSDPGVIADAIDMALALLGRPEQWTLVHGACPTGADEMADTVAAFIGNDNVERHPARWDAEGKAAGPLRNQRMVDLGADICLAFHLPGSRGTDDCIRRAQRAGIKTVIFDWR